MKPEWVTWLIGCLNIGLLTLYVCLIYRQFNQMKRTTRGQTYQAVMDNVSSVNRMFVDYPEIAQLWDKVPYVGTKGTPEEVRESWAITSMMDSYENVFFQHEQGNIPAEIWERWRRHIINAFGNTRVLQQWEIAKQVYYGPFREFVDRALASSNQERKEEMQIPAKEIYLALVQMTIHASATRWNRFSSFLLTNSILALAWCAIYVSPVGTTSTKVILMIIASLGILGTPCWAFLGIRGSRFLKKYIELGRLMEDDPACWDGNLANYRPFAATENLRDQTKDRYFGSYYFLIGGPVVFAVLYIVLLVISIRS